MNEENPIKPHDVINISDSEGEDEDEDDEENAQRPEVIDADQYFKDEDDGLLASFDTQDDERECADIVSSFTNYWEDKGGSTPKDDE
jgi:hypothetical protein